MSVPTVPFIWGRLKDRFGISPAAERIVKTVISAAFLILATVRMAGSTFSPFLYFRF